VHVGLLLVANRQPAVLRQLRKRSLHPLVPSYSLAGLDLTSGDARGYAPFPERFTAAGEVVALVGMQRLKTFLRPARTTAGPIDRLDAIHSLLQDFESWTFAGLRLLRSSYDTVNQEPIPGAASGVIESDCEVIGL
jgi:hypothetical protein